MLKNKIKKIKIQIILILILMLITIINMSATSFAKYVFDYTEYAVKIDVDRTSPIFNIEYSDKEITNKEVIVTITSNENIQQVEGWILLEDGKTLIKTYYQNINENIIIKDLSNNESKANIIINNIDQTPPLLEKVGTKKNNCLKVNSKQKIV